MGAFRNGYQSSMSVLARVIASFATLAVVCAVGPGLSGASSPEQWSAPVRVEPADLSPDNVGIYGLSCPTIGMCVAVDAGGFALVWRNGTWSLPHDTDAGGSLNSVSCATTRFCVAISSGGKAVTYNGTTWSPFGTVGPPATYEVSCPTSRFCVAVGANGRPGGPSFVSTFADGSWSSFQTASGTARGRLLDVACPSNSDCVAVNFNGHILSFDGTRWSDSKRVVANGLDSVACPVSSFCLAVTSSGSYVTLDHSVWSAPKAIPRFGSRFARSVSCSSLRSCEVLGLDGAAARWQGQQFLSPVVVFGGGYVATITVSCPSPHHCVAVNSRGQAATYS